MLEVLKDFYDLEYQAERYAATLVATEPAFYPTLRSFIERYELRIRNVWKLDAGAEPFKT
jgi:hypothetical protein